MSRARQGYAATRVQARFSRRPALHELRMLDSSRSVAHLQEAVRHGPLARYLAGLGPAADSDDFEARLRATWRGACEEVARWHEPAWKPAFATFSAHADLVALESLRADGDACPWLQGDPRLGPIARTEPAARATLVSTRYPAHLGTAFGGVEPLRPAWWRAWQASWPATSRSERTSLRAIGAELTAPRVADEREIDARRGRLERLFRRSVGTPAAAFAYLALLAAALERVRGSRAALLIADGGAS